MVSTGGWTNLNQKGDTGMYGLDFVSVVVGYVIGIVLCYSTVHVMFLETNDEGE